MNITLLRTTTAGVISAVTLLFSASFLFSFPANAANCSGRACVYIDGQDSTLSKEQARQMKEQWDESKSLRQKKMLRNEKEFDKTDRAIDDEDSCLKNANLNAYWEPSTRRCLNRRTGLPLTY